MPRFCGTDNPSGLGETLARQIQDAKNNEDTFRTFNIPLSELNKLEENTDFIYSIIQQIV